MGQKRRRWRQDLDVSEFDSTERLSISFSIELLQWLSGDRLSVGCQDLNFVGFVVAAIGPDDFLVGCDFENLDWATGMIAADDRIAVW